MLPLYKKREIAQAQEAYDNSIRIFNNMLPENMKPLFNSIKDGMYMYHIYRGLWAILTILEELKVRSFCDLGSGGGLLCNAIKSYFTSQLKHNSRYPKVGKINQTLTRPFMVTGYELNPKLLKLSHNLSNSMVNFIEKDILTLSKDDLKRHEVLYFWEPFVDENLAKQFIENLAKNCYNGQYIIYIPGGGQCREALKANKRFKQLSHSLYKVV